MLDINAIAASNAIRKWILTGTPPGQKQRGLPRI
jgi:hypothetical protein